MLKIFAKYTSIGVINTIIHWLVFLVCVYLLNTNQSIANLLGFTFAVTFSFFANAKFTFKASVSIVKYILYVGFMGLLSVVTGWLSDIHKLPPIVTLVVFSVISLICGFFYSRYIVFKK